MIGLSSLRCDLDGWQEELASEDERRFTNVVPDYLSLHFFALEPDLPVGMSNIEEIRHLYREGIHQAGGALISVELVYLDHEPALELIFKLPQEPSGMSYVASITLPKRDFSFVIKFQCPEYGTTGLREALVIEKLGPENLLSPDGEFINWQQDPYDPGIEAPLLRNKAESVEWDEIVPDHPLSRVRRYLAHLYETCGIGGEVKTAAPFG